MKRIFAVIMVSVIVLSGRAYAGMNEAESLYKEGKIEEAFAEYKKLLPELKPAQAINVFMKLGGDFYKQGKYPEAEDAFRTVLKVEGISGRNMSTAQFLIAHSLYSRKKYEEAIPEYRKLDAIKDMPLSQRADAQRHIGHCYRILGKNEEALAEYRKVVAMEGVYPTHLSNTQSMIGYLTKSEEEYAKVFDIEKASVTDLTQALRMVKNKELLLKGYVFQLKTNPDKDGVIKLGLKEKLLAREAVRQIPGEAAVVSNLLSPALLEELPDREEAVILAEIWQANPGSSDEAKSRLSGIIGEVSTIEKAREKIKNLK